MSRIALLRISAIILLGCTLQACEARHYEVVERACQEDGQRADYCRCVRRQMKQEIGFESYQVFSDLVVLGGSAEITSEAVLQTMEKHNLTPASLADIREAIDKAGAVADERCAG